MTPTPTSTLTLPTPGAWTGEDVVCIGGGPSMRKFDWLSLARPGRSFRVIAANQSFIKAGRNADYGIAIDQKLIDLWEASGEFSPRSNRIVPEHLIYPIQNKLYPDLPIVHVARCLVTDLWPLDSWDHGFQVGGNSGMASVFLADMLGARRIYLVGMDCGVRCELHGNWSCECPHAECNPDKSRQKWWHVGYPWSAGSRRGYDGVLERFEHWLPHVRAEIVVVGDSRLSEKWARGAGPWVK